MRCDRDVTIAVLATRLRSSEHLIAPVARSVTHVAVHVEKPSLPQVDRAAHQL